MSDVIDEPREADATSRMEYDAFCRARREMHRCLLNWLNTRPAEADVDIELVPMPEILRQLRELMR